MRRTNNQKGMTLVELMVALALGAVLITMTVFAVSMSFRLYNRSTALSEGSLLKSTLYHTISDELRSAQLAGSVTAGQDTLRYWSPLHGGSEVEMALTDGRLTVDGEAVLSNAAYVGYELASISFTDLGGDCVEVLYQLNHPAYDINGEELRLVVRNLN